MEKIRQNKTREFIEIKRDSSGRFASRDKKKYEEYKKNKIAKLERQLKKLQGS